MVVAQVALEHLQQVRAGDVVTGQAGSAVLHPAGDQAQQLELVLPVQCGQTRVGGGQVFADLPVLDQHGDGVLVKAVPVAGRLWRRPMTARMVSSSGLPARSRTERE